MFGYQLKVSIFYQFNYFGEIYVFLVFFHLNNELTNKQEKQLKQ